MAEYAGNQTIKGWVGGVAYDDSQLSEQEAHEAQPASFRKREPVVVQTILVALAGVLNVLVVGDIISITQSEAVEAASVGIVDALAAFGVFTARKKVTPVLF